MNVVSIYALGPIPTGAALGQAARVPSAALTPRELEVAVLVARGRTSRQVADILCVSARTVDNHLQRVFGKLGIASRSDLASGLQRLGIDAS